MITDEYIKIRISSQKFSPRTSPFSQPLRSLLKFQTLILALFIRVIYQSFTLPMASTPATGPYSKPSESQTPQESAPVKQKASQDADPGDPQLGTAQAWKSKFDEE
jgi:hypothetical protein